MRAITSDILERRQKIQSDLEELNARRDVLVRRLAALDTLLEMEREVGGAPPVSPTPVVSMGRKDRVPLTPKVIRILEEHPDWASLPRNEQMQLISKQLILEGHDFKGKDAFLSVGFALTQMMRKRNLAEHAQNSLNGDDGSPDQE